MKKKSCLRCLWEDARVFMSTPPQQRSCRDAHKQINNERKTEVDLVERERLVAMVNNCIFGALFSPFPPCFHLLYFFPILL